MEDLDLYMHRVLSGTRLPQHGRSVILAVAICHAAKMTPGDARAVLKAISVDTGVVRGGGA